MGPGSRSSRTNCPTAHRSLLFAATDQRGVAVHAAVLFSPLPQDSVKLMRIISLNIGRPQLHLRDGRPYSTAIDRRPVEGPLELTESGLVDDRVSDSKSHGGPDKALCCYPHEHYAAWRALLASPLTVPSFGENLTTEGLLEDAICIGDTLAIGSAVLQDRKSVV